MRPGEPSGKAKEREFISREGGMWVSCEPMVDVVEKGGNGGFFKSELEWSSAGNLGFFEHKL